MADYAAVLGFGRIIPGANTVNAVVIIGDRLQGIAGSLIAVAALLAILVALASLSNSFAAVLDVWAALSGSRLPRDRDGRQDSRRAGRQGPCARRSRPGRSRRFRGDGAHPGTFGRGTEPSQAFRMSRAQTSSARLQGRHCRRWSTLGSRCPEPLYMHKLRPAAEAA